MLGLEPGARRLGLHETLIARIQLRPEHVDLAAQGRGFPDRLVERCFETSDSSPFLVELGMQIEKMGGPNLIGRKQLGDMRMAFIECLGDLRLVSTLCVGRGTEIGEALLFLPNESPYRLQLALRPSLDLVDLLMRLLARGRDLVLGVTGDRDNLFQGPETAPFVEISEQCGVRGR